MADQTLTFTLGGVTPIEDGTVTHDLHIQSFISFQFIGNWIEYLTDEKSTSISYACFQFQVFIIFTLSRSCFVNFF